MITTLRRHFSGTAFCVLLVTHIYCATRSHVSSSIALPSLHSGAGYYLFTFLSSCRQVELPARFTLRSTSSSTLFSQLLRLLLGFPVRRLPSVGSGEIKNNSNFLSMYDGSAQCGQNTGTLLSNYKRHC